MTQIFYLTTEIERGLGIENILLNYNIIYVIPSQLEEPIKNNGISITKAEPRMTPSGKYIYSSTDILKDNKIKDFINKQTGNKKDQAHILSFRPSNSLDSIISELGYRNINPYKKIHDILFDKSLTADFLSQLDFIHIPKYINFTKLSDLNYNDLVKKGFGYEFYLQFISGQSGKGTYRIASDSELYELQKEHPLKKGKVSSKINGPTITVNGCATRLGTIIGGISEQITGLKELTSSIGGSVGNDFTQRFLDDGSRLILIETVQKLGDILFQHGYKGIFGVDFVFSRDDNKFYLIEINPRQVQSTNYYSYLQQMKNNVPISLLHILELIDHDYSVRFNILQPEYEETIYKKILEIKNSDNLTNFNISSNLPINASQVIFRNNTPNPIKIMDTFPSGIYRIRGRLPQQSADLENQSEHYLQVYPVREDGFNNLCLMSRGYNILDAKKSDGFFIDISPSGLKLETHIEYMRMQFLDSAFSSSDSQYLKGWIHDIFGTIKDNSRIIEIKDLNMSE